MVRQAGCPLHVLIVTVMVTAVTACGGVSQPSRKHSPSAGPATRVAGPRSFLYVVPPAGGVPQPLLRPAEAARLQTVADPQWSPDGQRIAFTAGCPTCSPHLYIVSGTGGDLREIPTGPGGVLSPSWSPDGRSIAFARQRGEQQVIVAVDLRTLRVRLVNGEPPGADNTDSTPAWSPDGRQIAFAREIHHENVTLWVVPAAGGSPRRLIPGSRATDQSHPSWSPDGSEVAYMQTVGSAVTWDLFVLDVRTGAARRLTSDPHNEFDPAWSPDGKDVVFASDAASRWGFRSLNVIGATGSGLRRLTGGSADDSMPSWSPDGKQIVFVRRPTTRI